jgi:hypothetical protein
MAVGLVKLAVAVRSLDANAFPVRIREDASR